MTGSIKNSKFLPLLFAADINVYSMARAFHEAYGIKSKVFGKALGGPCADSAIIDYKSVPGADTKEVLPKLVCSVAEANPDLQILVIGCGDSYVRTIVECKSQFPENVIAPYSDFALIDELTDKERFYALCEQKGIDYPDTFIHRADMSFDCELPFEGPFIVKPADSVKYWMHPFEGQDKAFKLESASEVATVLQKIYVAGYNGSVIIQNYIPGDDSFMHVLTCYSDQKNKVKMTCLGHVLLEEHTPQGIGNHAVIITESNKELTDRFRTLLEDISYTGFSNFDIKYDRRDGKYKVFELNARQGRSNYYVTGSGANTARLLVEDRIMGHELKSIDVSTESLWMMVPLKTALENIDKGFASEINRLISEGKSVSPLMYEKDQGLMHKLKILRNRLKYRKSFRTYYHREAHEQ